MPKSLANQSSASPIILLIAAALLSMGRLIACDFTNWDDDSTVHHNSRMNPPTLKTVQHYWQHSAGSLYIPVTYTLWSGLAIIAKLNAPDPSGNWLNPNIFHAANVIAHVGCVLLVFSILQQLTRHRTAAVIGAVLFAVHPIQVEAVGWVSGMKDVLWGLLSLSAIDLYLRATPDDEETPRRFSLPLYLAATACFALAMLAKPTAMVTPGLVLVIDVLLRRRSWRPSWRSIAMRLLPWIALTVPVMIVTRIVQPGAATDGGPLWARPMIALDSLFFYATKLLWPATLTPDYGRTPAVVIASGQVWWTWIAPAIIGLLAIIQLRRRPWIAAGLLLFIIGMAPMLGWIPFSFQFFSTTADHYAYASMLGVSLIVACAVRSVEQRRSTCIIAGMIVVALCVRSIAQAGIWADNRSLLNHMMAANPNSYPAANLLADAELAADRRDSAEALYRKSIDLQPRYPLPHNHLADLLIKTGRASEAIEHIRIYVSAAANASPGIKRLLADPDAALGIYYLDHSNRPAAAKAFRAASARLPDDPALKSLLKQSEDK